jgi:hypothetical protein
MENNSGDIIGQVLREPGIFLFALLNFDRTSVADLIGALSAISAGNKKRSGKRIIPCEYTH